MAFTPDNDDDNNGNNIVRIETRVYSEEELDKRMQFLKETEMKIKELKLSVIEMLIENTVNNVLIWQLYNQKEMIFETQFDSETPFAPTYVKISNTIQRNKEYVTLVVNNKVYCKSILNSDILDETIPIHSEDPISLKVKEAVQTLWEELTSKIYDRHAYHKKIILEKVVRDLKLLSNNQLGEQQCLNQSTSILH